MDAFGFAIFVDGFILLHGPFSHAILFLGNFMDFWLQAGVFQWQSVLLTFIVGGVPSLWSIYLGAGDTLLMLSWSGGLSLEELLQILFLASLFGISVFLFTLSVIKSWKSCLSFLFEQCVADCPSS